ncbi:GPI inositol-deacylase PGAP1-like [Macleaya cordata]|uniref:GPI inositol-deacylase PGAP1-like n=1 Tax=Macleaya cordata TaxID=56857 RepID=A0A200PNN5_MACCD|nr:GPI inositol-deacylase PGAP1-like [Macleaya cordata]
MNMIRFCIRTRRSLQFRFLRTISFSSSSSSSRQSQKNPLEFPPVNVQNTQHVPNSPPPMLSLSPSPSFSLSRKSIIAISATLISAGIVSAALIFSDDDPLKTKDSGYSYADLENSIEKSKNSVMRVLNQMKQTGVATTVLWKSLSSVLSSANQEVRLGFELRVASLLADIVAANESRRSAIVGAGGGAVVDWLLETVSSKGDNNGTQAESARALAYLISDPNVCEAVLGRPHAVPNLLKFIFSFQPRRSKKQVRRSSLDSPETSKGRSMLVAAIMDIVTSNCDSVDKVSFRPCLPAHADIRDIAAAIEVIEEGGMHLDENEDGEDDDGGKGLRGIGIKVLGGTSVLGFSRTNGPLHNDDQVGPVRYVPTTMMLQKGHDSLRAEGNLVSVSAPGLWDDLQCQHVAVPFAAWALANWALASDFNRSHIQELDQDGHAVMTALMAPERTVKWHGSLVARLLLEDNNLPLFDSVPEWSSSLLSTVSQASKTEDIPLVRVALSAFLVSVERSRGAQKVVMEKGLHLMRNIAKETQKHGHVQESLAKVLELLCTGDMHLSLEESQKWSSILLPWVCGKFSSDNLRVSGTNILSYILETYGPSSIPISQGWLTIMLREILGSSKTTSSKGNTQPKGDNKVKTQIDQSNALFAEQSANQLAVAVVNLAGNQLGTNTDSVDTFPLADLLSVEPFAVPFKTMNKDNLRKFDAADSALATLKGIKALTEVCAEDSVCQNKIADFGVLCLLRRFLLRDDYEQLAAIETYDASRVLEMQERVKNPPGELSVVDSNDSSSVRVPPTAHIRRHAARLLTILSVLPKVRKTIIADETWCKWLDDCANGKIPGCNDLKIQSYARATLLNIFCAEKMDKTSDDDNVHDRDLGNQKSMCPRYNDIIFLINPELPHWKCPDKTDSNTAQNDTPSATKPLFGNGSSSYHEESADGECTTVTENSNYDSLPASVNGSENCSQNEDPILDIVFVHGLRGGPFKTWRIAENKSSTTSKSGLVEKIDQEAGKLGTFWPREWLAADFPDARLFSVKYKTNLTQWSGATLPLQEVSLMLLKKLIAAGIGNRPVVFVTHSMGGLVVKQMLHQAKAENFDEFVNNTVGIVFYSCPHFGSKLADMPWRMGLVFRPAPSIGELRSGCERLVELNDFVRQLHNKGMLEVLSFSETKVTPIVEGYGGWALRMEIVPLESAYPGYGELVVLESTDHINSCKPVNRSDPSYKEILDLLRKLKAHCT